VKPVIGLGTRARRERRRRQQPKHRDRERKGSAPRQSGGADHHVAVKESWDSHKTQIRADVEGTKRNGCCILSLFYAQPRRTSPTPPKNGTWAKARGSGSRPTARRCAARTINQEDPWLSPAKVRPPSDLRRGPPSGPMARGIARKREANADPTGKRSRVHSNTLTDHPHGSAGVRDENSDISCRGGRREGDVSHPDRRGLFSCFDRPDDGHPVVRGRRHGRRTPNHPITAFLGDTWPLDRPRCPHGHSARGDGERHHRG